MSLLMLTRAWLADCGTATAKLVLLSLADHHNGKSHRCDPSIRRVATLCCTSERSVQRSIRQLAAQGHITLDNRPGRSWSFKLHPRQIVTPDKLSPLTPCPNTPDKLTGGGVTDCRGRGDRVSPKPELTRIKPEFNRENVLKTSPLNKSPKPRRVEIIP